MKAIQILEVIEKQEGSHLWLDDGSGYPKSCIKEAIKELEERQKEDEYIYQNMKESLSMGNKAQSLSFVEVYQIINKRLNK